MVDSTRESVCNNSITQWPLRTRGGGCAPVGECVSVREPDSKCAVLCTDNCRLCFCSYIKAAGLKPATAAGKTKYAIDVELWNCEEVRQLVKTMVYPSLTEGSRRLQILSTYLESPVFMMLPTAVCSAFAQSVVPASAE